MKRSEVDSKYKWHIEDMYKSDELWEKDLKFLEESVKEYDKFKGTLSLSSKNLLEYLEFSDNIEIKLENVFVYANQKSHEDLGNGKYQDYAAKAQNIAVKLSSVSAFASPELLDMDETILKKYLEEEKGLIPFKKYIDDLLRQKNHILDEKTEEILAKSNNVSSAAKDIYSMFDNVDARFEPAYDSDNNEHILTQANFTKLEESSDRVLRKNAFLNLYKEFEQYKNTLAATFNANVKQSLFYADVRGYSSSRAMYLDDSNIPEAVYDNLIDVVNERMDLMHKYVSIRKKQLNVSKLHMYDVYTPIVADFDMKVSFEEAKDIVKKGLLPMGEEYISHLQEGFDNGWIDIYENEGKRNGAYSWGSYGTHPYVLLNYQDNLNNVFTLAHEMGHALHSYYSDHTQPHAMAGYKIFVAEVASTCNESLLILDLIKNSTDKKEKAFLINNFLEHFKGTLYRQTMFAEFERDAHKLSQDGQTLTADVLSDMYYKLNEKYFGKDMCVDKEISIEWARIPHFYTPFYVYQYATGFSAAIALANRILKLKDEGVKDYMKFLTGGQSKDPIELLKLAGVDMTQKEPISQALDVFEELLKEFEEL